MKPPSCRCGKGCPVVIFKRRDGVRVPTTRCYLTWLSKEMKLRFPK